MRRVHPFAWGFPNPQIPSKFPPPQKKASKHKKTIRIRAGFLPAKAGSLSLRRPLSVSLSLCQPFPISFSASQPLTASLSLSQPLSAFLTLSQSLPASPSPSQALSGSLSLSQRLSASLNLFQPYLNRSPYLSAVLQLNPSGAKRSESVGRSTKARPERSEGSS